MYLQSFLLWDVKGGCHVDEGGEAVQVVAVGMRKDGVCLNKRGAGGGKREDAISSLKYTHLLDLCNVCFAMAQKH